MPRRPRTAPSAAKTQVETAAFPSQVQATIAGSAVKLGKTQMDIDAKKMEVALKAVERQQKAYDLTKEATLDGMSEGLGL